MFFDRISFFSLLLFFSSPNFKRGGALAPPMDEPPLPIGIQLQNGGLSEIRNTTNNYRHLSTRCINIYYYCIFLPLNGIFDTELVQLYLIESFQMNIKYHFDPEVLSLTMNIRGPPKKIATHNHNLS